VEGEALAQVERDERRVRDGQAGGQEGFFGGGAHGEEVVGLREGGEAVVERGVGDEEGAAR